MEEKQKRENATPKLLGSLVKYCVFQFLLLFLMRISTDKYIKIQFWFHLTGLFLFLFSVILFSHGSFSSFSSFSLILFLHLFHSHHSVSLNEHHSLFQKCHLEKTDFQLSLSLCAFFSCKNKDIK